MDTLEKSYVQKRAQYEALIAQNDPSKVSELKDLNAQLAKILQSMLVELSTVKNDATKIDAYRDELIKKLIKVQNDHNAMLQQRDHVNTLRELKGHEQSRFNATFFWYALFLAIVSIIFVIALMWKGGYKAPAMPTMISNPTTMLPLTYI
jgi:hypothetical protein